MAFTATQAFLGVPTFNIVHIDPIEVAKSLQVYLDTASKITGVSLDDISLRVSTLPPNVKTVTLTDLITRGMKLFDALVWLTAGRPESHKLMADPTLKTENIPSTHTVAKSLFFVYFLLITQARYPAIVQTQEKIKIPNFLSKIMGMEQQQEYYMGMLCSFEPQLFDPSWVKYVTFKGFGQEVMSRLGLGVAGYRMFGPFKLYTPKEGMDISLMPAFEFARTVANAPASWDIHPLTRNPNVLKARGNLNKNLGNLMLDCFTAEQLQEMASTKVIFKVPTREAGHIEYRQWAERDDITGRALIFPKTA